MFDVITVGSNVVDVFVKTDPNESDLIKIRHGKAGSPFENLIAYPLGTKILINHIEFMTGGGGTNTAVSFSRLGLNTAYLGKIGKDQNGLKIFDMLKSESISFIGALGDTNGYSIVLDSVKEDRTILTYKGCSNDLSFKEIHKTKLKAKAYYLCSMLGESFKTLEQVSAHAKKQKALVAFNPSSYLTKSGINPIKKILKNTHFLILNEEEAKALGGFGEVKDIAQRLQKYGPKTVVITRGVQGVFAMEGKVSYQAKPKKNLLVHETTGAGDAFGSTFFAAMLRKHTITQAIKMAMINAESVISNYGAKNILLNYDELMRLVRSDKRSIKSLKR